ncbi:MAG: large-conductance mechanosensitive channel [Methyloligella sp.]|nr:MAG: large-conductance mechanosensitive channel [Methyloligella sp.]
MGMLGEFKEFALKSNFVDMATGIVIGGAIGTVVKSLVSDIIMPPIGLALGGIDFSELAIKLQDKVGDKPEVAIKYGSFINNLISFLIIMAAIFMIIKVINTAKAQFEKEEEEKASEPPRNEVLLEEIRDLLKK